MKIIIISSLPGVFVIVIAKISILGYFPKNPIFGYFAIFGYFGVFWQILPFSPFSSFFPILAIFPFLGILVILGYFGELGKNEENRIIAIVWENSKNGVF